MSQLWLEEADEHVWHRVTRQTRGPAWRAACGWELSALRGRAWPQKPGEAGPPLIERCHDCVSGERTPPWESDDADNLDRPTPV
jgi:hypothetical protein